tara:strand:+ start:308 stop:1159 length:852 start_codon:yes stop_codon:yes gene_type:complete
MISDLTSDNLKFARFLLFWRSLFKLSQEQMADRINCSARHVSRLENGLSHPSQSLVNAIIDAFSLGQRDSSHLMIAAGFLPTEERTSVFDIHAPEMNWLRKSMTLSLKALDPYPSVLTDDINDILMVNRGWVGLFSQIISASVIENTSNLTEFLFSREGAGSYISGRENTLSVILMSLEQRSLYTNEHRDIRLRDKLAAHKIVPPDWRERASRLEPMPSFKIQLSLEGELRKFINVTSSVSTLGPAVQLSGKSLNLSTFYPEEDEMALSNFCNSSLSHPLLYY